MAGVAMSMARRVWASIAVLSAGLATPLCAWTVEHQTASGPEVRLSGTANDLTPDPVTGAFLQSLFYGTDATCGSGQPMPMDAYFGLESEDAVWEVHILFDLVQSGGQWIAELPEAYYYEVAPSDSFAQIEWHDQEAFRVDIESFECLSPREGLISLRYFGRLHSTQPEAVPRTQTIKGALDAHVRF